MIVERELLKVPGSSDVELLRVVGSQPGPTLAVLGGVHGDEPEGVFAAWRLFAEIQRQELHGTVLIVPVASPEAFAAGTRLSPLDGGNLARSFPGSPTGTATERLASLLAARVIAACDLLVDLHAAGRDYRMPFFAGAVDDGSPTGAASAAAARAFAAPLTWLHDAMNPGRTISAAWDRGIPCVRRVGRRGVAQRARRRRLRHRRPCRDGAPPHDARAGRSATGGRQRAARRHRRRGRWTAGPGGRLPDPRSRSR